MNDRPLPPGAHGRRRVLVVAPPEENARITLALDRAELELALVGITTEAELDAALAQDVDAVILSPGVPGLELSGAIARLRQHGSAAPFIVVSRRHDDAELSATMRAGAADYVGGDQMARLAPALFRELSRAGRRAADTAGAQDTRGLLQAIVDGLPFVLFVKDAEELRVRIMNRLALELLGKTRDEMMGKLDHEYLPAEQADAFMKDDREVLATGVPKVMDEVARAQGVDLWFRTRKVAITAGDGKRYVMGVTEEITQQRAAEDALRKSKQELELANQRLQENLVELKKSRNISARTLATYQQRALQMEIIRQQNEDLDRLAQDLARAKQKEEERAREIEQAARLKSEFLANFSHEIRTPLNGILGYCDLLMREEGSRLTPHGRRDLTVVKANAKALLALINDILDLSKIEAGHVDVVREVVAVQPLLDECVATVRDYLRGREVQVVVTVAPDATTIETDTLKLRQIVLNLLSNAAKFTEAGEIVVEARREGDALLLTVEDTGAGIPADQLPFIFDKFRQVDGSSTRKVGGTGLGLAIVRELCRVLGGSVGVKSTVGRGSTFTVRIGGAFTAVRRPSSDATLASSKPEILPGSTVLVVDDDPLIHQLLTRELEREGLAVLPAVDGVGALAAAREHRPDAVVLDIYLPKLNGWSVLAELKSDPSLSEIPVVIISVEEQRARGFSLGACDYLVKPFEAQHLVETVSRSLGADGGEVLVVDDDDATRELVCRQLRAARFAAVEAASGGEALARLRDKPPALLVLDLVMPEMSGFDLLSQLRQEQIDVPVVVLTGKSLTPTETQTLRDGMAAIVQKNGMTLDHVVAEAKRLLLERRAATPKALPRVLYVEDSAQNRDVVRRYLRGTFEVLEAEDGEHGLDRAQREQPDLILMDLSLPRLDGWEATRRLKAGPLAHIPVVALTAHAGREDQARARAAGCDGYLTKPVDREVLIATIRKHLEARETVS